MKLGDHERLRELTARLIELLQLEAEEEGAMFRLSRESEGRGTAADLVPDGKPARELPAELLGIISSALSRLDRGGQLSVLLSSRETDGNLAIVIAEMEREWERVSASPDGTQAQGQAQTQTPRRPRPGSIEVDSVAGLGTTFTIRLPEEELGQ